MHILLLLMFLLASNAQSTVDLDARINRLETMMGNLLSVIMMNDENQRARMVKRQAIDEPVYDNDMETAINQLTLQDLQNLLQCRDGMDGEAGAPGPVAEKGATGETGTAGMPGVKGETGTAGMPGVKGETGSAGIPGVQGETGAAGIPGVKGEPGRGGLAGELTVTGSIYTRWGRRSCAGNSSLIYEGFAASAAYHSIGGGTNYQCLPLNPEQDSLHMPNTHARSVIAGTEYQSWSYGPFPSSAHDQNVPCARCYSPNSAVMMIPATTQCPLGWQREYHGYLMTANTFTHDHQATYECVDRYPEYVRGLQGNTEGAVFVFVVPDCDGLDTTGHCPPYNANRKLLCAVCTK